ncbi:MAG: LapA family protein [Xanthomonadales bacterium]|nr:LapA family protein [Xanthomonadales bacterium]
MRRLASTLLALLVLLAGGALGLLNPDPVTVDLYGWSLRLPLGVLLWLAVLAGALIAGAVWAAGRLWPRERGTPRAGHDSDAGLGP